MPHSATLGSGPSFLESIKTARQVLADDTKAKWERENVAIKAQREKAKTVRLAAEENARRMLEESRMNANEYGENLLQELGKNVKARIESECRDEIRESVRAEYNKISSAYMKVAKDDVRTKLEEQLEPVVKAELAMKYEKEVRRKLIIELEAEVKEELRGQFVEKIQEQLALELEAEVREDLQTELEDEVRQQLYMDLKRSVEEEPRRQLNDKAVARSEHEAEGEDEKVDGQEPSTRGDDDGHGNEEPGIIGDEDGDEDIFHTAATNGIVDHSETKGEPEYPDLTNYEDLHAHDQSAASEKRLEENTAAHETFDTAIEQQEGGSPMPDERNIQTNFVSNLEPEAKQEPHTEDLGHNTFVTIVDQQEEVQTTFVSNLKAEIKREPHTEELGHDTFVTVTDQQEEAHRNSYILDRQKQFSPSKSPTPTLSGRVLKRSFGDTDVEHDGATSPVAKKLRPSPPNEQSAELMPTAMSNAFVLPEESIIEESNISVYQDGQEVLNENVQIEQVASGLEDLQDSLGEEGDYYSEDDESLGLGSEEEEGYEDYDEDERRPEDGNIEEEEEYSSEDSAARAKAAALKVQGFSQNDAIALSDSDEDNADADADRASEGRHA
ncbi:hypothetical protein MMC21_007525 [Puttea exsequens]|nr:hypothetical protein [Puttea exsequens]